MKIIGLTGYARSGKDTVARMIRTRVNQSDHDCEILAFAEPMKTFAREVFGFTDEQLYGDTRDVPDQRWQRPDGSFLTPRYALQTLGTEWGRNCDPNVWVKAGLMRAARSLAEVVVFTDVRFLNEAAQIRKAGGQLWRVDRGVERRHAHESEAFIWAADMSLHVTREIRNTGSLMELATTVAAALRAPT